MIPLLFLLALFIHFAKGERLAISWSRPRVGRSDFTNLITTGDQFLQLHKLVHLDVCQNRLIAIGSNWTFEWSYYHQISPLKKVFLEKKVTNNCKADWIAPVEGQFAVRTLAIQNRTVKAAGVTDIHVKDIWIVVMGDSYLSGEGCPNVPRISSNSPAVWIDKKCHRSNNSFPFLAYQSLADAHPQVQFILTYTACSGASIQHGLLGEFLSEPPQVEVVKGIQNQIASKCPHDCKIRPDLLVMSIGANDLQFGQLVEALMLQLDLDVQMAEIPARLDSLEFHYANLSGSLLGDLNLTSERILFVDYFDPLQNFPAVDSGKCGDFGDANLFELQLAKQLIVQPFFQLIANAVSDYQWTSVKKVGGNLNSNGLCGTDSHVANIIESLITQGDEYGAFHPNCKGHFNSAAQLYIDVEKHLKQLKSL